MKYVLIGVWIFSAPAITDAAEALPTEGAAHREILVRTNKAHGIPGSILIPAMGVATRVLAQAGVSVRWGKTADSDAPVPVGGCRDRHLSVMDIAFLPKAPAMVPPSAMAHAFPFASGGVRIQVFWGSILDMHPASRPELQRSLLGHVLAHEIAHVLIGTKEHSAWGLMKAKWTFAEEGSMQLRPLPMSVTDMEAMRQNLDAELQPCPAVVMAARR